MNNLIEQIERRHRCNDPTCENRGNVCAVCGPQAIHVHCTSQHTRHWASAWVRLAPIFQAVVDVLVSELKKKGSALRLRPSTTLSLAQMQQSGRRTI
jgi:hypothetical protein